MALEFERRDPLKVLLMGNGADDQSTSSCGCVISRREADFILARGTFSIQAEDNAEFPDA